MEIQPKNSSDRKKRVSKIGFALSLGMVIGAGLGIAFGLLIDNITLGLVLGAGGGLVIGLNVGTTLDQRSTN
jgi:F0F1-type ATP synthase assembly protein I